MDGRLQDPFNHVLYSNRSACYAELGDDEATKALADGQRCVALNPEFQKGFSRLGFALYQLGRYAEAEKAAENGLAVKGTVPVAKGLLDLLEKCRLETKESLEFQKQIHLLRVNKRRDAKMQEVMKSLNLGGMGGGVQMFNGMGGLGGAGGLGSLLSGMGGGGMGGMGGLGGMGGPSMTDAQMRQMAHATSSAVGGDASAGGSGS